MSRQLSPRLPSARAWKGRGNGFRLPGVMEVFNAKAAPQFAQCGDTGNCKKRELRRELRGCHDADLRHCRSFDVGRFILARARPEDYVVVKVDVEGFEYKLLDHWQALGVDRLIDEIFVEFHFATDNPKLTKSSWNERATRSYGKDRPMTKDNATAYFDTTTESCAECENAWSGYVVTYTLLGVALCLAAPARCAPPRPCRPARPYVPPRPPARGRAAPPWP